MADDRDSEPIQRLLEIMALLRDPVKGCPWDVEQTFSSIAPHTIEEAYEVAEAIERRDMDSLRDELGDVLLQVVFHARMAEEAGQFDFSGVVEAICDKLVRRHPHVFGDLHIADAARQTRAWEDHKARERREKAATLAAGHSAIDGVSVALPALTRAFKLQKRAARVGFDWSDVQGVLDKLTEEADELAGVLAENAMPERILDEVGDLLFSCVNLARKLDVDPETALRHANTKFERRFRAMEAGLGKAPEEATLAEMDTVWDRVKAGERPTATTARHHRDGS